MNVVQNNLISIVILLILFLGIYKQVNWKDPIYRSFLALLCINTAMLIFEIIVYLLIGVDGTAVHIIIAGSAVMYHVLIPFILFMTFVFFDYHFHEKLYKPMIYAIPFAILFVVNVVLIILSFSQGYVFSLTSDNIYGPGSMYIYYELATYVVFMIIFLYAAIQRKKVSNNTFVQLGLFTIPLSGGILLIAFADFIYVTWNAMMISLLIVYIFMQLQITSTDYLTGLQNRRGYEYLLFNLNKSKVIDEKIVGIMIDIDNFKTINDEFGHMVGDEALRCISKMLKQSVRKNDFVSRTGGDEFAIVIQSNEPNIGEMVVERINNQLQEFNDKMDFGFKLYISIGCDRYDEKKHQSIPEFFKHLDHEMYRDKNESERVIAS